MSLPMGSQDRWVVPLGGGSSNVASWGGLPEAVLSLVAQRDALSQAMHFRVARAIVWCCPFSPSVAPQGYCHVKYSTPEAAAAAIAQLNGIEFPPLSNQHLKVIYAEQDPARDNRASGGSASNASLHHVLPHGAPPGVHGGPRSPMAMSLRARSPSPVHMPLSPAAVSALSPDVASVQETLANMSVPTAHGRFTMGT